MIAILKTGGKQYIVKAGDVLKVEKIEGEPGALVKLDTVLMVSDGSNVQVGAPTVQGAFVEAEIIEQTRGEKVIAFKRRPRHDFKKKIGHRQHLTKIKIKDIKVS
ncbi:MULTISPECIES: 50S ribosomal protein L21 [Calditerrivibrio]|uniref:Large ribosomal subunit protein bL21 n=1 Tax=Calditerrivibrio nitroreducens (strain DSM 19672 / NBRC 101217 / Yu37-1) TaxID=768670 RepID=E4THS1_CALNY|nr:50S ribosomal protein L21 [Calditerrivibrio nitroreducens]ADR19932.1 LSU ribosomal protein L21P [Calditerrivibrio nitroreducens DSM 19672]